MTIYVCVVLSTNKQDKPNCLVVFVTELNWPVLNICTPSSFTLLKIRCSGSFYLELSPWPFVGRAQTIPQFFAANSTRPISAIPSLRKEC